MTRIISCTFARIVTKMSMAGCLEAHSAVIGRRTLQKLKPREAQQCVLFGKIQISGLAT